MIKVCRAHKLTYMIQKNGAELYGGHIDTEDESLRRALKFVAERGGCSADKLMTIAKSVYKDL